MKTKVNLVPFETQPTNEPCVKAQVHLRNHHLELIYEWGALERFRERPFFPWLSQRRHHLWQRTCFEAFWSWSGLKKYWELNLSLSGDWNLYVFSGYRQHLRQEYMLSVKFRDELTRLIINLDLNPLVDNMKLKRTDVFELGLAAVIQNYEDHLKKTHWALTHPRQQPDFHDRRSFCLHFVGSSQKVVKCN